MPETGVRPPFFTFAAVLAIAPVAGMPPNIAEKILPAPCATSSILELCLELIMLSDTTQDNKDSTAARIAMVSAFPNWERIKSKLITGKENIGGLLDIS